MAVASRLIGFLAESIVRTVREPLLVLDDGLRVVTANQAFYQAFEVTPQETEDTLIYERSVILECNTTFLRSAPGPCC
jgi:two-component system CheB/CheR fusion protein